MEEFTGSSNSSKYVESDPAAGWKSRKREKSENITVLNGLSHILSETFDNAVICDQYLGNAIESASVLALMK